MSDRMNLYDSAKEHRISEKSEVLCFFFCRMEEIMATESSIMDSNSFKEEYASMLSPKTREMISKREKYLGGAYRLFIESHLTLSVEKEIICGMMKVINILICITM